jgi:hypothetical protein
MTDRYLLLVPIEGDLEVIPLQFKGIYPQAIDEYVGGYNERVPLPPLPQPRFYDLWVNEEGLMRQLEVNPRLSVFGFPDPLVGPGLLTSSIWTEGGLVTGLTQREIDFLLSLF